MQIIKVRKAELLEKVRINRDAHRELFLKAQEGFRQRAIEELDDMLRLAKEGRDVRLYVGLEAPEDHTDEYNRAIEMLEMETGDEVQITRQDFAQLVRNEWAWFHNATIKNTLYSSGGKLGSSR